MQPLIVPVKNSACTKYMSVPREMNLLESFDVFFLKMNRLEPQHYKCVQKKNSKRICTGDRPSEWYRGQNWWGGMCISWNSWWRCSIARTSKICLDWHQKSDFEFNSNIHLRHSCNQNMQNIVTWGQNIWAQTSRNLYVSQWEDLFSGVLPGRISQSINSVYR